MTPASEATTIWRNARLATLAVGAPGLGVVDRGAIVARAGRVVFAGPEPEAPTVPSDARTIDCEGRWITPGLIDCHTHLVYAGSRAAEFEARLAGASYEEIARAGGGIVSTVHATRAASEDELVRQSLPRLDALIAEGVTTVEIKSGYGLDLPTERKMLRAARRLAAERPVEVRATFLGAHALPPEYAEDRAGYVAEVADAMLPALASEGLVDAVDGFCEGIAFSRDEMRRVFASARSLRLPVKLHAEQLSNSAARRWRPNSGLFPPNISNTSMTTMSSRWRARASSPPSRPAPSTCCARRRRPRSTSSGATACRWRSRPTATPAPRR